MCVLHIIAPHDFEIKDVLKSPTCFSLQHLNYDLGSYSLGRRLQRRILGILGEFGSAFCKSAY